MKVVLFCGGLGLRIRDQASNVPKPMISIGYRPILWHVMKYYAHFGHTEFILCLGHGADVIKNYFLNYDECLSNDFVLTNGGKDVQLLRTDTHDWKISFVDTGPNTNIGQRLKKVRKYLEGEEMFLANYSDGLTDCVLPKVIDYLRANRMTAVFLSVKPNLSYHFVTVKDGGTVTALSNIENSGVRINGGYYVFRKEIFDYINEEEELVNEPFQRLINKEQLAAFRYDGFFTAMDTFKDKQHLEDLYVTGQAPWELWKQG